MEQELRLGNVTCPVQPCKVPIIENLNNLRINVFGYEDEEVFPLYISKREDIQVINLLYTTQGNDKHYCLIKNMSRLLGGWLVVWGLMAQEPFLAKLRQTYGV
ncbi:hypothetical protein AVEN_197451-1 [Araneus ventricosus]|uniref:Uncharacterized protein n=1 Tax=Araneus ventricosus TaxID=182803 RepID=A0A4Y2IBS2_ARAVE|nr:hypothetical protein AVEN_197451-1 [Araneus ventricosus]